MNLFVLGWKDKEVIETYSNDEHPYVTFHRIHHSIKDYLFRCVCAFHKRCTYNSIFALILNACLMIK